MQNNVIKLIQIMEEPFSSKERFFLLYAIFKFALIFSVFNEVTKQPSDERSAGGSGEGEPYHCGSPDRPFLLYRQRHVFFSAGRKENVGLEQWVLKVATLMLVKVEETYASSTRNGYFLYARIFSAGACGAVLSTGGKYPKTAGAFRCAPDPWRLLRRRRARNIVHLGMQ